MVLGLSEYLYDVVSGNEEMDLFFVGSGISSGFRVVISVAARIYLFV